MSVLAVLDDIKGGLPSDNPEDNTNPDNISETPALEAIQAKIPQMEKNMDLQKLLEDVHATESLSKALALEVFTMLPPMVNIENQLTSAPSAYNKKLLLGRVSQYDSKEEIRSFINEVLTEVINIRETAYKVRGLTDAFLALTEPEVKRLDVCAPIVLYPGGQFNLLMDHIERIAEKDDSLYGYAPYEGQLRDKYAQILYHSEYNDIKKRAGHDSEVSVLQIQRYLRECCHYYSEIDKRIDSLTDRLSRFDNQTGMKYIIEDAVQLIKCVPSDFVFFNGKESLAEKIVDILKFLR